MDDNMSFHDKYLDVLQNIESAIIMVYKDFPEDFTDHDVSYALEALIDAYVAEKIGRDPKSFSLNGKSEAAYKLVKLFCDWRLGRRVLEIRSSEDNNDYEDEGIEEGIVEDVSIEDEGFEEETELIEPEKRKTVDEIIQCLKAVLKSVHRWNKRYGRKGYLNFISQYV